MEKYLFEVSYEEWLKKMKELIRFQKQKLACLIALRDKATDPIHIMYLDREIETYERGIYQNEVLIKIAEESKDELLFFIDEDGIPLCQHIGSERKRKYLHRMSEVAKMYR